MKILTAQQIKEGDSFTIKNEPITSFELMERAAKACTIRIIKNFDDEHNFVIVCGKGNNGGDGLAIARMLHERKRKVEIFIVNHSKKGSEDFESNLKRIQDFEKIKVTVCNTIEDFSFKINSETILIDCIFGTGINKPASGLAAEIIEKMNNTKVAIIAIDVPSGLYCDEPFKEKCTVINAFVTFTFQQPKLSFLFAENEMHVGEIQIIDIGIDDKFLDSAKTDFTLLDIRDIKSCLKTRPKFSNKGTFGHALLMNGSFGKMGAAVLAARACTKSGAGLVTTKIPNCGVVIMQTTVPEAMVLSDENENEISAVPHLENYNAVGAGSGIGLDKTTQKAIKLLIQNCAVPLVLDADALNILSDNKTWIAFLPPYTILTPHPKEFDRLTGNHTNGYDRLSAARTFSKKHKQIIVLKGAHTAIVLPDGNVFFNSTGNPSMAKGGSGDVLTGIITGLLARGYNPVEAACIGVYLHGLASDLVIKKIHPEATTASDIIGKLGKAFEKVYN